MRIVHAASEFFPFIKTGGLADAAAALSHSLARSGHEVSVFLPGYRKVLEHPDLADSEKVMTLGVEMDDVYYRGQVRSRKLAPNLTLYLVCRDEYFDRSHPYGPNARDYEDNGERFLFFCKAIVKALGQLRLKPDVLHCHDWQTALTPLLLHAEEQHRGVILAGKTVLTVHNLAFQGVFSMRLFPLTNLPDELRGVEGIEYYGQLSFLKGGILFSDRVTTVSPTYGREILTPDFGCGLDGVLASREQDLFCQVNGIDTSVWDSETDVYLPAHYSAKNLSGKSQCRQALLKETGLQAKKDTPVYAMISRLTSQKGLGLLQEVFPFFIKRDCRLIILGSGEIQFERWLCEVAEEHPDHVSVRIGFDEKFSHLIEAGSDFFLMPSTFEPCGLNQLYSMHYGTVPLASHVGGLADTVIDADLDPKNGTGLSFNPNAADFESALERSYQLFQDKPRLRRLIRRMMEKDFSWENAARNYERMYRDLL